MSALKADIINDVQDERARQDEKWGPQSMPNGTGPGGVLAGRSFASYERILKSTVDSLAKTGDNSWIRIFLEEAFEAAAEEDPRKLRIELIQVMAVAQAWVEDIDRKHGAELLQ